jgi:hypothetical protein
VTRGLIDLRAWRDDAECVRFRAVRDGSHLLRIDYQLDLDPVDTAQAHKKPLIVNRGILRAVNGFEPGRRGVTDDAEKVALAAEDAADRTADELELVFGLPPHLEVAAAVAGAEQPLRDIRQIEAPSRSIGRRYVAKLVRCCVDREPQKRVRRGRSPIRRRGERRRDRKKQCEERPHAVMLLL